MAARSSQEPTLVLLHELGGSGESWQWVRANLRSSGVEVLAPDLLPSATFDDPAPDVQDVALEVGKHLETTRDGPWVVAGVAYGAVVGAALAGAYPDRVRSLIWCCMGADLRPDIQEYIADRNVKLRASGVEAHLRESLRKVHPPLFRVVGRGRYLAHRDILMREDPARYAKLSESLAVAAPRIRSLLEGVSAPTTTVAAMLDRHFRPSEVHAVGAYLGGEVRHRTLLSGHFPHMQRPAALARLATNALASARSTGDE